MSSSLRKVKTKNRKITIRKILKNKKKRIRLYLLTSGMILTFIGFFLARLSPKPASLKVTRENSSSEVVSFSQEPVNIDKSFTVQKQKESQKDAPVRIVIPELNIDLPVKEAKVKNGYWEVFSDSAGFGIGSAYPDEIGNQIIFAHAREGLFLPLKKTKVGQVIYIYTKDKWYQYKVVSIKEVFPTQTEVIAPTNDYTLTLYTCSGFADSKRLIVTAKRVQ